MPFKIRNKGMIPTANVRTPRKTPSEINDFSIMPAVTLPPTRFTTMRIHHNYRNISRAMKQFLMNDIYLENMSIVTLRIFFKRPLQYKTPIFNNPLIVCLNLRVYDLDGDLKDSIPRNLADNLDRHYSLICNNQHPMQLFIYEEYNKMVRDIHSPEIQERRDFIAKRIMELTEEKLKKLHWKEGESISPEDTQAIYLQAVKEERNRRQFPESRTRTGEINDYLEVRRPFGANE